MAGNKGQDAHVFIKRTRCPYSASRVYRFHMLPGAFDRLVPPWQRVRIIEQDPRISESSKVILLIGSWPFQFIWSLKHHDVIEGSEFTDEQVTGPFVSWRHTHRFIQESDTSSFLEDEIHYEFPLGWFGRVFLKPIMERKLSRLFDYRHVVTLNAIHAEDTRSGSETCVTSADTLTSYARG